MKKSRRRVVSLTRNGPNPEMPGPGRLGLATARFRRATAVTARRVVRQDARVKPGLTSDGRISSLPWRRERGPHPWLMAAETPKVRVALADLLQPRVVHLGRSPLLRFGPSPPKHRAGGRQ